MKLKYSILIIGLMFIVAGCYQGINGTVVDEETGKPIEGAVVLVEWTITCGLPGLTHTKSYKVIEVVTDKEGKYLISGLYNPFVDAPDLTIYKNGYVAWNNLIVFPEHKRREEFKWHTGTIYKLEPFKDSYSYVDHYSFIVSAARPESAIDKKMLFIKAYEESERIKAIKERDGKQRGGVYK